jgi:hypothetical protein
MARGASDERCIGEGWEPMAEDPAGRRFLVPARHPRSIIQIRREIIEATTQSHALAVEIAHSVKAEADF